MAAKKTNQKNRGAVKKREEKLFVLDHETDSGSEYFWSNGHTAEEAVAEAISDGCEFEGTVRVFETVDHGTFKIAKKLVGEREAA